MDKEQKIAVVICDDDAELAGLLKNCTDEFFSAAKITGYEILMFQSAQEICDNVPYADIAADTVAPHNLKKG